MGRPDTRATCSTLAGAADRQKPSNGDTAGIRKMAGTITRSQPNGGRH
jgi:hypothetical protein